MSAAISLPYFWNKMRGRAFEELFDDAMKTDPGLAFLEQDILVRHVDLSLYSGDNAIRTALAIQEATARLQPDQVSEALKSRIRWYIREYCLVGTLVTEASSEQACTIARSGEDLRSDPYIYSVVLSALLRYGAISVEHVRAASSQRRLDLADADNPGRIAAALSNLTEGTDSYRIYAEHHTHNNGRDELAEFERVIALAQGA